MMKVQCPVCQTEYDLEPGTYQCQCGAKFFVEDPNGTAETFTSSDEDPNKTIAPRHHVDYDPAFDQTMPGKRDRKPDGRFEPGNLIMGRYKVLAELGQGGMGVVYKCFDETAGVEIALKALPPELSHNTLEMEDIKENFQLVHNLHHPNIASSNTLEKDNANGNYYLIMECVEGEDLRRWIKRKRRENSLTLETVLPVVRQVAAALDYAHEQKIIHRDIKPGNIMIDQQGQVKVLDFGLAAQIHTSMTRVSMAYHGTSGTGPYMAPEQWRGRAQGAAADQYALAVMTYEMLAGHLPFESSDAAVLKQAVLDEEPEPLANVTRNVQTAVSLGMSKDPAERFSSCSEFVDVLEGQNTYGANRKNGKGMWVALAVVIVLALIGIGYGCHQSAKAQRIAEEQRIAAERLQKAEEQRLAEEQRIAAERQRKAEEQRIAAERQRKAEEQRIAEEKQRKAEGQRIAEKMQQRKQKLLLAAEDIKISTRRVSKKRDSADVATSTSSISVPPRQTERPTFHAQKFPAFNYQHALKGNIPELPASSDVRAGILVDADTGNVLWDKQASLPVPIASMTKIMTLFLACEDIQAGRNGITLQSPVKVSSAAARIGGSQVWLDPKETFPLEELLKAVAIKSANDAAYQVAEFLGEGEVYGFVERMNRRAREIGMKHTQFHNPHGMPGKTSAEENISSPADMALLAEYCLQHDDLMKWAAMPRADFRGGKTELVNHNNLLTGRKYSALGVDGLRTGFTKQAGYCMTVTCKRGGKRLIAVITGFRGAKNRDLFARSLLDWGYAKLENPVAANRQSNQIKNGDMRIHLPDGEELEMVKIKAGSFMMGSPTGELGRYDNERQHRVTLTRDFWLGTFEVTQGQWKAVMGSNPSYLKKGNNYPVENVSWRDAKKFCEKLNASYSTLFKSIKIEAADGTLRLATCGVNQEV